MNRLSALGSFAGKTFPLWILLFAAAAYFSPDAFRPLSGWIGVLLGIVMFGMGVTLTADDVRGILASPRDVAIGAAAQFVIMPAVAYLLCVLMDLPPEIAAGVILVGCCPGGTASNVMTFLARGNTALSIAVTCFTTLLAPVATPCLVWLLARQWIPVSPGAMFQSVFQVVIIPVAAGFAVRAVFKDRMRIVAGILPLVSVVAIVMILSAVVAVSRDRLASTGGLVFAVVILHNAIGYALGWMAARLACMDPARRRCLSIEVGMQNSGLAVALAAAHFAAMPAAAVPGAVFSFWHNISGPLLAAFFRRMDDKKASPCVSDTEQSRT